MNVHNGPTHYAFSLHITGHNYVIDNILSVLVLLVLQRRGTTAEVDGASFGGGLVGDFLGGVATLFGCGRSIGISFGINLVVDLLARLLFS